MDFPELPQKVCNLLVTLVVLTLRMLARRTSTGVLLAEELGMIPLAPFDMLAQATSFADLIGLEVIVRIHQWLKWVHIKAVLTNGVLQKQQWCTVSLSALLRITCM